MCKCIEKLNGLLEEHNTKITIPLVWNPAGLDTAQPLIQTEKVNTKKRGRPKKLFASYCPFCGEKYKIDDK